MSRPRLLDLFCCAGGAAAGYYRAGFDVFGVDIEPQPNYPFPFAQEDAIAFAYARGWNFDVIHASPPCQAYTNAQKIRGYEHPALVGAMRSVFGLLRLGGWRGEWVIENVVGAPLRDPVLLCGAMFGLRTYRHRLFESSVRLEAPPHHYHNAKTTKMGRAPRDGEMMHVVGNFSGVAAARKAMGIEWMTRDELREAIPPAYTEHLGRQLLAHINAKRAA